MTTATNSLRRGSFIALLVCSASALRSEQFESFDYRVIGESVEIYYYPCPGSGSLDIPSVIDGKPVSSIDDRTFRYCTGLTSVTIPESVTLIGESAFSYYTGLSEITIPSSVNSIEYGTFAEYTGLTSVSSEWVTTECVLGFCELVRSRMQANVVASVTWWRRWGRPVAASG